MRNPFRLIGSSILGGVLLLTVGVGSTFAASPIIEKYDLDDAWCFGDVSDLQCTVQKGTFTIETKPDGSTIGTVRLTTKVEFTANGVYVASYTVKTQQQSVSNADGSYTSSAFDKTRWTNGEERCNSQTRLTIVDFEVVVDEFKSTCD